MHHQSLFFVYEMRIGFLVPIHHLVDILVVLLETSKLFLHKHTATVVEMVSGQVFQILHTLPTGHSLNFTVVAVSEVVATEKGEAQ